MISFEHLCQDLNRLVGATISSIRPGSNLLIKQIDQKNKTIEIVDKKGKSRTRPFSELYKIWLELRDGKPVHVDSVLGGSGTCRNQPETILGNLPYVEWLYISGKKHLILAEKKTHETGTLKQMDSLKVQDLVCAKGKNEDKAVLTIIIFDDIRKGAHLCGELTSSSPVPQREGIYNIKTTFQHILLVSQSEISPPIPCGCYPVFTGPKTNLQGIPFVFLGKKYELISVLGNKLFYAQE